MALTVQEIGTMIKAGISPLIFVVNNEGYTVERLIWGAQQRTNPVHPPSLIFHANNIPKAYNDIVPHNYSHLLPLYYHPSPATSFHRASTKTEAESIFAKPGLRNPEALQLVEIVVPKLDTSWRLASQLAWRGEKDAERLTREGFVDTYGGWGLDGVERGVVKWS